MKKQESVTYVGNRECNLSLGVQQLVTELNNEKLW